MNASPLEASIVRMPERMLDSFSNVITETRRIIQGLDSDGNPRFYAIINEAHYQADPIAALLDAQDRIRSFAAALAAGAAPDAQTAGLDDLPTLSEKELEAFTKPEKLETSADGGDPLRTLIPRMLMRLPE